MNPNPDESTPPPVPVDYDENPDRFRTGSRMAWKYGPGDVHAPVADRLAQEGLGPVLDLGCGEGRLLGLLRARGVRAVGLDLSRTMLSAVENPCVRADAVRLPFPSARFGGVAALWMLYHLAHPDAAIRESHRVLRPGGLFVAAAPNRDNDPELAEVLPPEASPFDAEEAPAIVGRFFQNVEVERWDAPMIHLPGREDVATYLIGRGVTPQAAGEAAQNLPVPLSITKRGAMVFAHK